MSVEEMKAFIGAILNMGIIQLPNLKDYWAKNNTTNIPFFRSLFSGNRFFQNLGTLHAGDIDSTVCKQKIQPVLHILCPRFISAYIPDKHAAIDESVISLVEELGFSST